MQPNVPNSTLAELDVAVNDLGPLAWVLDELRKSLDGAAKALKRFVRDAEAARGSDLGALDGSQLRIARQQLHQAVGALEMVGLPGPALVLRAMEAAVQRFVQQPEQCNQDAAAKIERASFALTEYLEAVLADRPISAVSLFPQYREVQELVRADRVHPADLWAYEWRWLDLDLGADAAVPLSYDNPAASVMDRAVLQLMKGEAPLAASQLRDLSLAFSANQVEQQPRIFWAIAAAYFEALKHNLLKPDLYVRRASSRILMQYSSLGRGEASLSERLAHDLLFFCAQAVSLRASDTPVLSAIRSAYGLTRFKPVDYETVQFGRFDPALLAQARKRITSAKETWSSLSAGELSKFKTVTDQFSLVTDSLVKLHPPSEPLAQALTRAVDTTVRSGQAPGIELAMEVATSVLYLEAAFDDLDPSDPQLAVRTANLADRLEGVRAGGAPQPLEGWMEELYRRVSDKHTMGSVVGELRISLGELEKSLDVFFRNPQDKAALQSVPAQLSQMRGVLSVLGLDQASHAVLRMKDSVEQMLVTEVDEQLARAAGTFDHLGNNLGALSFLIDMLNYQPALAKKLFVYDEENGELKPLMGRMTSAANAASAVSVKADMVPPQVISAGVPAENLTDKLDALATHAALADQPELAQSAREASAAVLSNDADAASLALSNLASALAPEPVSPASIPVAVDFEEDDLRDIFLEEAREVLGNGSTAINALESDPGDEGQLTILRRAFHTLKGSSRMVGLNEFGEAAWSLEQMLNSWLADQKPASDELQALCAQAMAGFTSWVGDIAAGQDALWSSIPFRKSAEAMRLDGRYVPLSFVSDTAPAVDLAEGAAIGLPVQIPEAAEVGDVIVDTFGTGDALAATQVIDIFSLDIPDSDAPDAALDAAASEQSGLSAVTDASEIPGLPEVPEMDFDFGDGVLDSGTVPVDEPESAFATIDEAIESLAEFDAFFDNAPAVQPHGTAVQPTPDLLTGMADIEGIDFESLSALAGHHDEVPVAAADAEVSGFDFSESAELTPDEFDSHFSELSPLEVTPEPAGLDIFAADELLDTAPVEAVATETIAPAALPSLEPGEASEPFEILASDQASAMAEFGPLDNLEPLVAEGQSETSGLPEESGLLEASALPEVSAFDVLEAPDAAVESAWQRQDSDHHDAAGNTTSADGSPDDQTKVIGSLRIGIPLYNVYLNEADEWSRRLVTEVAEWALEGHHPVSESTIALAHSLAGSSATVGFHALSEISRALENALQQSHAHHSNGASQYGQLFVDASEDIRRLLHQFAAGFLKEPDASLLERLKDLEFIDSVLPLPGENVDAYLYGEHVLREQHEHAGEASLDAETETFNVTDASAGQAGPDETVWTDHSAADLTPEVLVSTVSTISTAWTEEAEPAASTLAPVPALPAVRLVWPAQPTVPVTSIAARSTQQDDDDIDAVDAIDQDLFPIFEEEGTELMPQLGGALRQWSARPDNQSARLEVLRALHTLKGSARLAGALRLGEMAHRIESEIEHLGSDEAANQEFEPLLARFDSMQSAFEKLRHPVAVESAPESTLYVIEPAAPVEETADTALPPAGMQGSTVAAADFSPVADSGSRSIMVPAPQAMVMQSVRQAATASVRVRSQLLDRMVNQAGEVMITRSRLEAELGNLRGSLNDMSGNLNRLRQQLRDIELQAETQMQSRLAQAKEAQAGFDPLEFDRFTRVQELTRMMAESVNDVATVQRTLQRTVESTEDDLIAQARQTRELQRDLLRTRMVEFEGISDRLYRVVRLASKETGKQVKLDLLGGTIEMDRSMLDRMTPAFEHLLRNCVAHGIESPQARLDAGKDAAGLITVHLRHEGNDVSVDFSDDGAGLDLQRIREKAQNLGLVAPGQFLDDAEAANLIFMPGFSTATEITELSGRGIGMDVVRAEVNAVGGRIETTTVAGQGTHFKLVLPLTTAVTQVVMIRAGTLSVGVPASVVETVRRATAKELQQAYNSGTLDVAGEAVPFFWSGALLQASHRSADAQGKTTPVVVFRSAAQRIALHVDEVIGNQEVVVKNLGPQMSRLPGLAGMSVLASGAVVLIYNPVALASVYGEQARAWSSDRAEPHMLEASDGGAATTPALMPQAPKIPLILVVDDSITVRRVTQRLLQREGYRVAMAADGLQALERLQEEVPSVVLSDIEMPRMDGFDLARNIRADARLAKLPIIMITSRIAEKHREHARELGVDNYLGKPYSEDELMNLVRQYCAAEAAVSA